MSGEKSAYEVLGLRHTAGRVEIDEAYRRLIKQFHPDRTGGDGSRAAEINRAYTELRRMPPPSSARSPSTARPPPSARPPSTSRPAAARAALRPPVRRRRFGRTGLVIAFAAAAAAVVGMADPAGIRWPALGSPQPRWSGVVDRQPAIAEPAPLTSFEEPLQTEVVHRAIADAVQFHSTGDPADAADFSRDCQTMLRNQPNLAWFDACSAFDEATLMLNGTDPLAESGQFSGSAVMTREIAAAQSLSDDMLGADSRLHQIRLQIELELLPILDPAAAGQQKI